MDPSHPPLDFAFHGLADLGSCARWVDGFDGALGHPADGIWLRHGSAQVHDARRTWLRVGTLRGDRFPGTDRRESLTAFTAMFTLVDATMPSPDDRPTDYKRRIVDFADGRAEDHAEWPQVRWTIDGVPVTASVMTFAGAWAAYATLPLVDLAVVGHGLDPDGLALAEVVDSSTYHFDRHTRLVFPETIEQSRAAAEADPGTDEPVWWPTHPDHAAAMEGSTD